MPTLDLGLTAGLGYVRGSVTNASYWGENLLPTLNPHVGSQALPYAIAFPTHAGQDDGTALRLSILSASVATADGDLALKGGWFDPARQIVLAIATASVYSTTAWPFWSLKKLSTIPLIVTFV